MRIDLVQWNVMNSVIQYARYLQQTYDPKMQKAVCIYRKPGETDYRLCDKKYLHVFGILDSWVVFTVE